ncbi:MAG: hypothetical protein HZA88_18910 [Verrucomicrobia bacterium]|nr:hypothetical protein [Verrucomicrobiota bacterium]
MNKFIRNHKKLMVVIAMFLVFMAWSPTAEVRGRVVAKLDLACGHYEVQSYGHPAFWKREYAKLLRERYGIECRTVAGCCVWDSLVSYVRAYNGVVKAAMKRKFGRDVFKECAEDAEKACLERTRKAAQTE